MRSATAAFTCSILNGGASAWAVWIWCVLPRSKAATAGCATFYVSYKNSHIIAYEYVDGEIDDEIRIESEIFGKI